MPATLTVSIGVATTTDDLLNKLIHRAETPLFHAQETGGNRSFDGGDTGFSPLGPAFPFYDDAFCPGDRS